MSKILVLVAALAWIVLATDVCADTVYLKNGQSLWGREAYEEGDVVVIVRPGGEVRIPKSQVNRIERLQSTLPPFFTPPEDKSSTQEPSQRTLQPGPAGGRPTTAPGTPAPGSPGAPGGELSPPPTTGAPVPPRTTSEGTRPQPPPPPPTPGR